MQVMSQEVHARFLEETPLSFATSTLEFSGFLTEGYAINTRKETEMFEILDGNSVSASVQAVMVLVHFQTPYMIASDQDALDINTEVLHLEMHWNQTMPLSVKVGVL